MNKPNFLSMVFVPALLLAVAAPSLVGQTSSPPSPPTPAQMVANQVARLTTLLNLTSTQQSQATTIFTTEQTALSALRTSFMTAQTALQTAIEKNDSTGIATQAAAIGSLTTQQVTAQATANATFYAILTSDQQTKFQQLSGPGGLGGGPGRGPGGPGGPPPPPGD